MNSNSCSTVPTQAMSLSLRNLPQNAGLYCWPCSTMLLFTSIYQLAQSVYIACPLLLVLGPLYDGSSFNGAILPDIKSY